MLARVHIDKGATLFKLPGHPTWYLDLCARGTRSRRSLGTTSKDQALTIARQLVREALYESWGVPQLQDTTFKAFLEEYKKHCTTHNAEKTRVSDLYTLNLFTGFLQESHKRTTELKLSDVMVKDVEAFQAWRQAKITKKGKTTSPATVNRAIGVVSAFFNLAKKKGYVRLNPTAGITKLKTVKRVHQLLDEEQIPKLLEELDSPVACVGRGGKGKGNTRARIMPLRDIAVLILETGLRLGEALHLKWEDVDTKRRVLSVKCREEYTTKDREERTIGLNEGALSLLARRKLQAGTIPWVFPTKKKTPIEQTNALKQFKKAAARAGVPWTTFYTLRHTFATRAATSLPPFVLRQIMGHSSVRTTERYYIHGQSWYKTAIPPCLVSVK